MFPTPVSLAAIVPHVLVTFVLGLLLISFVEHAIHKHIMHRRRLFAWIYRLLPDLLTQFQNHAVLHHGTYYKQFDHEPNAEGKHFNLRILPPDTLRLVAAFLPLLVPLALFVSTVAAATVVVMIIGHNLVWGAVHTQMHIPEGNAWFRDTAYYRFIARHHFMHHQQPGRNYNVVLPLADFVIGTVAKPGIRDVREMLRLGYLRPRTVLGRRRLETRAKAEEARPCALAARLAAGAQEAPARPDDNAA